MRQIKITVKPREIRIDKFLALKIKNLTRSQVKKLIKEGNILVNNSRVAPDYEIQKGDTIKIELPLPKSPLEIKPQEIPLNVVFEDKNLLVLDKEEGMVVHPSVGHPTGTLVNALLAHYQNLPEFGESLRPGIVHRLDKETSGLILVAKDQDSLEELKKQFKNHTVIKKYTALVVGRLEPEIGTIEKPIARHPVVRNKFIVDQSGREAKTDYRVIEHIGDKATLVEVLPRTGRTHQIRVHVSNLSHPIFGDKLYGGKPAGRMFLHATYLEFTHPKTGKVEIFSSPLPSKLVLILDKIRREVAK
jgi:23S rRNA pseudouridine1911/1915/1917 synthase